MQQYAESVTDSKGNVVAGARVTILNLDGSPASLFQPDGVSTLANPVTSDPLGIFTFKAANGNYTRTVTIGGRTTSVPGQIVLDSPAEYARLAELAASDGAALVKFGPQTVADALTNSVVTGGMREAVVYNDSVSVRVFRSHAAMGGFRFRGQYSRGRAPVFPMPASKVASLSTNLGAGMTAATFENWYAVFACANANDATASIKIMPFLRAGTVSGSNIPFIKAGEGIHALTAQTYAWGATNNLANTDCLVISEAGGFSGRVAKITANTAGQITLDTIAAVAAYDFLLPAPPGFANYVYLGSFYFDTAEVRNIYDSGTLVKSKMIYLQSPSMGAGAFTPGANSKTMNCAGYISPLATAVTLDSSATLSTASAGDIAEYFDPDGSAHVVQTCYLYKASGTSQTYVFDNVQVPFMYHQKFNYSNAGALNGSRVSGQLNITGWIEP